MTLRLFYTQLAGMKKTMAAQVKWTTISQGISTSPRETGFGAAHQHQPAESAQNRSGAAALLHDPNPPVFYIASTPEGLMVAGWTYNKKIFER
jgi:hypothetical protein